MLIKTTKKQNKRTNCALEKKVLATLILRRFYRSLGGEAWKEKSISEEASSLAKLSAHWFDR